jgi:hypothetical protein
MHDNKELAEKCMEQCRKKNIKELNKLSLEQTRIIREKLKGG